MQAHYRNMKLNDDVSIFQRLKVNKQHLYVKLIEVTLFYDWVRSI